MAKTNLSRLMHVSWDIQRTKRKTRSKALMDAWAILGNEQIMLTYLVKKLNHHKPTPQKVVGQFALFSNQ